MEMLVRFARCLSMITTWTGAVLLAAAGMLMVSADTILRYAFSRPLPDTITVNQIGMVMMAVLPVAYVQFTGGHIRVGFLVQRLPARIQVLMRLLTLTLGIVYFGLLTWQTWQVALYAIRIGETTQGYYPLPVYVPKTAISVGTGIMTFWLVLEFIIGIGKLMRPGWQIDTGLLGDSWSRSELG